MAKRNTPRDPGFEKFASELTPGQAVMLGLGVVVFGMATMRYAPKLAKQVVPMIPDFLQTLCRMTPALPPLHPEVAEPVRTLIDERQLGRSEVIREIAVGKQN